MGRVVVVATGEVLEQMNGVEWRHSRFVAWTAGFMGGLWRREHLTVELDTKHEMRLSREAELRRVRKERKSCG